MRHDDAQWRKMEKMNSGSGCTVRREREERISQVYAKNIILVIMLTDLILKSVCIFNLKKTVRLVPH